MAASLLALLGVDKLFDCFSKAAAQQRKASTIYVSYIKTE
jgi:hypothetical protein